jgi:hypothetical protein
VRGDVDLRARLGEATGGVAVQLAGREASSTREEGEHLGRSGYEMARTVRPVEVGGP